MWSEPTFCQCFLRSETRNSASQRKPRTDHGKASHGKAITQTGEPRRRVATKALDAMKQYTYVDREHDVGEQLVLGHVDVPDGDAHAEDLLELELTGLARSDEKGHTLIVLLTSTTLRSRSSACEIGEGNGGHQSEIPDRWRTLPALDRPGPSRRGICLIKASEARKASYFLASWRGQRW